MIKEIIQYITDEQNKKIQIALYIFLGLIALKLLFWPTKGLSIPMGILLFAICLLLFIGAKRSKDDPFVAKILAYSGVGVLIFSTLMLTGFHDILASFLRNIPLNRGETWFLVGGIFLIYFSGKAKNESQGERLNNVGLFLVYAAIAFTIARHTNPKFDLQGIWFKWENVKVLKDQFFVFGAILTICAWIIFPKKRIRGIILALTGIPLLFIGISAQYKELGQALKNTPVIKLFVDDNNTVKSDKKNPLLTSVSETLNNHLGAFSRQLNADASQNRVASGIYSQNKRTWVINPGTLIYSCTGMACMVVNLTYDKPTEIISLSEEVQVNGVLYEKFSLPDPQTGQIGVHAGFIPSGKFLEKSGNGNSTATVGASGNTTAQKRSYITDLYFDGKRGSVYAKTVSLKRGTYFVVPGSRETQIHYSGDSKYRELENGKADVPYDQEVIFFSTLPEITIYKEEQ